MNKSKYKLSEKERKNKSNMLLTPLKKQDDIPTVEDIIKNDAMYAQIAFVSRLMVYNLTTQELRERYEEEFGEKISAYKINKLRHAARMVYLTQTVTERDSLVAEELMRIDWEAKELMEAWDKSKQGGLKKTKHKANSNGSEMMTYDLDEETIEATRSFGDIRYMEQLGKVRQRYINLLGLEAPKQQAQQQNNTMPTVTVNIVDSPRRNIVVEDIKVSNDN